MNYRVDRKRDKKLRNDTENNTAVTTADNNNKLQLCFYVHK